MHCSSRHRDLALHWEVLFRAQLIFCPCFAFSSSAKLLAVRAVPCGGLLWGLCWPLSNTSLSHSLLDYLLTQQSLSIHSCPQDFSEPAVHMVFIQAQRGTHCWEFIGVDRALFVLLMLCMWILYCFQTKWDSVVCGFRSQIHFSFLSLGIARWKMVNAFLEEAELIYLTSVTLHGQWMEPLVLTEQWRVWSRAAGSSQRPAVTNLDFSPPTNSPATSAVFF